MLKNTRATKSNADEGDLGVVVGLVGHCGPDSGSLQRLVQRALPGARLMMMNSDAALAERPDEPTVLLVNRVLDGAFSTDSGIELIRTLQRRRDAVAAVLVSNYADAQQQAEAAGAMPGFGKSSLRSDSTEQRLQAAARAVLGQSAG